ncbi:MAG: hypothetical protein LBQ88_21690 [Treponema sp.]|jgi:hypothetical protein|nr:hypothetical protein [Treponema sp.]
MKKRIFLSLALAALTGGGVFAQTHFASAEVLFGGGGARYEYVITPYFTVGGYVSFNYMPTPYLDDDFSKSHTIFGIGISGRWYPWGRRFFAGLDLGYSLFTNKREEYNYSIYGNKIDEWDVWDSFSGFTIAPGFGWTIDIGKAGGFFISPGVKVPFILTSESDDLMGLGKGVLISGIIYFGVGWAF